MLMAKVLILVDKIIRMRPAAVADFCGLGEIFAASSVRFYPLVH